MNDDGPFVIAVTGASGAVYARRLLEVLLEAGYAVHWTISPSGATVWNRELGCELSLDRFDRTALGLRASEAALGRLVYHRYTDFTAPPASGSFRTSGMVVCPCSCGTLGAVAHGTAANFIQRAADVHLKEKRKLILVPRETPLSLVHLDNMKRACLAGAVILPASPGWYHGVATPDDLIDFIVARILDQLNVSHTISTRWGGV